MARKKGIDRFLEWFGRSMIPSRYVVPLERYFEKAGIYHIPYSAITIGFASATAVAVISFLLLIFPFLPRDQALAFAFAIPVFIIVEIFAIGLMIGVFYYYFNMKIFRRTVEIENVLPDFLDNLKLNMGEGMAFEKALLQSVEPEFGVLANEIEILSKKTMTGTPAEKALHEFADKYHSNVLKEAIDVLVIAIQEGSDIVETIDKIIETMRSGRYLVETIRAGVSGFIIFISLVCLIVAPILYALSLNLLFIFTSFAERLGGATSQFFSIRTDNLVTRDTFVLFSRVSITIVSVFSSLIIANLKEGTIKAAAKRVFIFTAISLVVYEVAKLMLAFLFGSIL